MPTPDNLNSAYLGQPGAADNINTAFLPETASEATINLRSDVSTRGDLFAQGGLTVGAALNSASAISGGVITGTLFSGGSLSHATLASSGITIGGSTAAGTMFITVGASGLSLGIESGGSLYFINSTVSAA